jgi:hypothetical protein
LNDGYHHKQIAAKHNAPTASEATIFTFMVENYGASA